MDRTITIELYIAKHTKNVEEVYNNYLNSSE